MILAYESAIYELEHDLYNVLWLIEDAQNRGIEITPDWLYRQDRYQRLIAKAEEQLERFTNQAMPLVHQAQHSGIVMGSTHGATIAGSMGIRGTFGSSINTRAVDALYQMMFDQDSPLREVLDSYTGNATAVIRHHLGQGVILGKSPREVVREIQRDLASGTNRARLSTLVRTEHMRAYRISQQQLFEQYRHAIASYMWMAALQPRTCFACLAMHGSVSKTPRGKNHANCRCIEIPMGRFTPARYRNTVTGEDWYAAQPAKVQRAMMPSQAAYDAYRNGDLTLQDFVGEHHSEKWGTSIYQVSGKAALLKSEARRARG